MGFRILLFIILLMTSFALFADVSEDVQKELLLRGERWVFRTWPEWRHRRQDLEGILNGALFEAMTNYERAGIPIQLAFYKTLKARLIDDLRRQDREQKNRRKFSAERLGAWTPRAESLQFDRGLIAQIEGFENLPALGQNILSLHYERGLTFEEIARHLDIPLGSVKSRLHRCLDKLRRLGSTNQ